MPSYCCVSGCKGATFVDNIKTDLKFHRLPTSESVLEQWVRALQLKGSLSNSKVCSGHFVDEDYFPPPIGLGKRRLKPFAVPTEGLPPSKRTSCAARAICSNSTIMKLASTVESPREFTKNQASPWRAILLPHVEGKAYLYVPKTGERSSSPPLSSRAKTPSKTPTKTPVKTRSPRFNSFQDLMLLREVASQNPFSSTLERPWDSVAAALKTYVPSVFGKSCKDRVFRLLKMHKEIDAVNLQRWESQEHVEEREELLMAIRRLEEKASSCDEEETCPKIGQEADVVKNVNASQIQEATMMASLNLRETVATDYVPVAATSDQDAESGRGSKRKRKEVSEDLSALPRKQLAAEARLREDEAKFLKDQMEVEERRLELEDRKLALDAKLWDAEEEDDRKEAKQMLMALMLMTMKK